MHTAWNRVNSVLTFSTTVLAGLCLFATAVGVQRSLNLPRATVHTGRPGCDPRGACLPWVPEHRDMAACRLPAPRQGRRAREGVADRKSAARAHPGVLLPPAYAPGAQRPGAPP